MILTVAGVPGADFCSEPNRTAMKANMGTADRVISVVLALVMAILYFTDTVGGTLGAVLLVLAGVFLLTSTVSFCPLYKPFGISTCKQ